VRKQSGIKLSTLAGRVLRTLGRAHGGWWIAEEDGIKVSEVRALAASVLSQDETKGQKAKRRRLRRRG